jgi:uncharacterized protein YcbX
MQKITVSSIHCYPIKSCGGIELQTAVVGAMGIQYDRQWMVVNEHDIFVAQRGDKGIGAIGIKTMCLINIAITDKHLVVNAPGMNAILLPLNGISGEERKVRVWDSFCTGIDQGDEIANWFTRYLSREMAGSYRLVRMPDAGDRKTEIGDSKLAFADGYPFLLTSEASLAQLNTMTDSPIPMNRFRPNIVITGYDAFAEDGLSRFHIGDISFHAAKPCARCPITTIDQATAEQGKFPLNALATFRKTKAGVLFGMNLNHLNAGSISIGDELTISQS